MKETTTETTKEEFKEIYFKYDVIDDEVSQDYWDKFYENPKKQNMKYLVEHPDKYNEPIMMVVNDYSINEYRLFFVSIDQENAFFDSPGI